MNLKNLLKKTEKTGLLREYDDNYYDKTRVYGTAAVKDLASAVSFALRLREIPGLRIDRVFFEDLELREEGAFPAEEPGDLDEGLLISMMSAADIDLVKFTGTYSKKRLEIGIDKRSWEVWLRIWHLTEEELGALETQLGLV